MALFARRTLQCLLNENSEFLTRDQALKVCGLLNSAHDNYLSTEWEQAVLNTAGKYGNVQHEIQLGRSKPDVFFKSHDGQLEFVADITTCSDESFHKLNPVEAFEQEFNRLTRKAGCPLGGYFLKIDPLTTNIYRGLDERIRLKLPPRSRWRESLFNAAFGAFLRDVKTEPEKKHAYDAVSPGVGVHISYDPAKRGFSGGSHMVYTLSPSIQGNPVYAALKSKGDQIKKAGYAGPAGVFVCDGDCNLLTANPPSWSSFSVHDIVQEICRQFDSIWFVVVLGIGADGTRLSIKPKIYLSAKKRGYDFSRLLETLRAICASFPEVRNTPINAKHQIKSKRVSGRYYGRLTQGGNVEMSAREMLEILAGTKPVSDFEQNYGMTTDANPFKRMLREGRLISKVTVERIPGRDDDKVTIEFGPPDPAVSKFRV